MKRQGFTLLAVCVLLLLPCEGAKGHGGQFKAPGDMVPPNLGGYGGPTPPGGPPAVGPTTPSPRGRFGTGNSMAPRGATTITPGKKIRRSEGFTRWEYWWMFNKGPFLFPKIRAAGVQNYSGCSGFLVGRGSKHRAVATRRPSRDTVKEVIAPLLTKALSCDQPDILDSAVLALARITPAEQGRSALPDLEQVLESRHRTARQSATLALGVLGAPEAIPVLYALMIDGAKGRRLVQMDKVPSEVRAFAALSLGFIDNAGTKDRLFTVIRRTPEREKDLSCCAVTALGLMKGDPRHEETVRFLLALLEDERLNPFVKASVPTALGKLGDPIALPAVVRVFEADRENRWVRQSCAIAMGRLARITDTGAMKLLERYIEKGKDEQTRNFCFIALGRIGGRDDRFEEHREEHKRLSDFFLSYIVRPRKATHLPWACLAAALHARTHEKLQPLVITKIQERFTREKNPSYKGAMAVSLGLLEAEGAAGRVFEALKRTRDKALQGYLCESLGLMEYKPAMDAIRRTAVLESASFRLRLQAATALGLMGDTSVVGEMIQVLENGVTLSTVTSAAKALGLLGDRSAVDPLRRIVENDRASPLVRGFACVALGLLADKRELPWSSVISEDYNYCAMPPSVAEMMDIL